MKLQLKHSTALAANLALEPVDSNMLDGELALNINQTDPRIFLKLSDGSIGQIPVARNKDQFTISSSGQIGLGTSVPNQSLDIHSSNPVIQLKDTTTNAIHKIDANSAAGNLGIKIDTTSASSASDFILFSRGTEKLRVMGTSGNLGVGTAGPSSLITISGDSALARLELNRSNAAGGGSYGAINFTALDGHSVASIHAKGDGDGDDNGGDIVFRTTSAATSNDPYAITERVRIASDGRIGLSGANYGSDNQVLTSQGTGVPEWRGVNAAFYGRQDAAHNVAHQTWTIMKNFASDAINTTGWNESTGVFTADASTAGVWYIFGCGAIDDLHSAEQVYMGVSKNNETPGVYTRNRAPQSVTNTIQTGVTVARVLSLSAGDTVCIKIWHNEGATQATEQNGCFVGGFRLSV